MKPKTPSDVENREINSSRSEAEPTNMADTLPTPVRTHPTANVAVGQNVRLRKSHPCGSYDWKVVRIGADIGLRCLGCDHRVTLTRPVFEKRFKSFL